MYLSLNNRFAIGTSNNLYFLGKQDDEKSKYFQTGPLTYEGNVYFKIVIFNIYLRNTVCICIKFSNSNFRCNLLSYKRLGKSMLTRPDYWKF